MCAAADSCVMCIKELCLSAKMCAYDSSQLSTSRSLYEIEVIKLVKSYN